MYKILTSTSSFENNSLFDEKEYTVMNNPLHRKLTEDEIIKHLKDVDGLIAGLEPLTQRVIENSPSLKVISRVGVGLDNVDIKAAENNGIRVFNTPDAPTDSVAELTLGMMLNLMRNLANHNRWVKEGIWKKEKGAELKGKIVGVIGYGRIGKRVAEILRIFKAKVLIYDPFIKSESNEFVINLKELLSQADIVTLHIPVVKEKKYFLDRDELDLLKQGAMLLNISRGGLLNEECLYELLESNKLGGAALDVYENEPYNGKLRSLNNVLLTPHIGSFTIEARLTMEREAVENLIKGLNG